MVEELKLAIKIDDATIEQSLLKQFANAQKMADKVVLDFKNVNFDDKQIEAKFKEMQKKAGQNPIDFSISGNTLDMLGQIDKRLTEIFSIGKGKSFIDSSSTVADIGKIENKINELNKKYEEAQKKLSSIGSGGISGKDVNLVDNKEFQKLSDNFEKIKGEIDELKQKINTIDIDTEWLDNFTTGLDEELTDTQAKLDNFINDFNSSFEKINTSTSNTLFNEESIRIFEKLLTSIESSLSSIKGILVDVGDGEELSPLLREINNIQTAIGGLSSSLNNLHFNMNIDMGTDNQMDAKIQEKAAKALNAYEKLFNGLKLSGYGGEVVNNKFFDFDINKFDTTIGKVKAYKDIIERLRKEAKEYYDGVDLLRTQTDDKLWRSASSAGGQLTQAINESAKSMTDNPLTELFGKTDLSGVIEQLNTIVSKLDEISISAKGFTETFKNGLNVNASVEEIEKLTNRVKELETELAKIKAPTTVTAPQESNISSENITPPSPPKKDRYAKRRKISEEDFLNYSPNRVNEKLSNSGYTILGETVNTELVDGLVKVSTKIKDADGAWKSFSAKVDADGNIFEQRFKTVTNGVDKLETALKNFGRETSPALTYQETLDKAQKIKNSLNLGDEYSIKVDSSEFVTITKKLTDVENTGASVTQTFKSAQDAIDNFGKSASNSAERTSVALKSVKSNIKEVTDESEKLANAQKEQNANVNLSKYDKRLDSYNGKVDKYQATIARFNDGGWTSDEYLKNIQAVKDAVNEYETLLNKLKGKDASLVTSDDISNLDEYDKKIKDTIATVTNMSAAEKGYNFVSGQKELDKIHKLLNENSKMSSEAKAEIRAYYTEIESGNPSMSLDRIHGEIMKIYNAEVEAGRAGRSFFDTLKNSGFHQIAAQMAGMVGVYDVINIGKEGFNVVRELNTALTEMRKVSDESLQSLKNYQDTTFDTADAVGTTAKQIQNSTADWMRLGESMNQAAESAKDANVLLNVSEFDNIDEATESLVSMSQAYKNLDKMDIIDVLNNIGNNYSISTDGLATALKDSASALVTANNDLNEAVSLTTAGNAITQDPSKVGAGLRTISLRLVGTEEAKQELSDLGEETDGMITTVSKLRDTIMDATKAASSDGKGFDILDSNGNYKSTYEIMQGLADLYDNIVKKDKELGTNNLNLLLETIAGKNRSNIAASILQNGDMLRSVYEDAQNSEGSAEKELNSYLDSIDGKMAQLENRAQEFWFKVIDSKTIKNGIDLLSILLKGATDFVDTVGLLPTILTGIGAGLSLKNIGKCYVSA